MPLVLVIVVKPPRFRTEPSGFNWRLDAFAEGFEKCGVLVRLKASARNWALTRSVNLNVR